MILTSFIQKRHLSFSHQLITINGRNLDWISKRKNKTLAFWWSRTLRSAPLAAASIVHVINTLRRAQGKPWLWSSGPIGTFTFSLPLLLRPMHISLPLPPLAPSVTQSLLTQVGYVDIFVYILNFFCVWNMNDFFYHKKQRQSSL